MGIGLPYLGSKVPAVQSVSDEQRRRLDAERLPADATLTGVRVVRVGDVEGLYLIGKSRGGM